MAEKRLPSGYQVLLGLNWIAYLQSFEAIDMWNPEDGSRPPNTNEWGFTSKPERIKRVIEIGFGITQTPIGQLFNEKTLPQIPIAERVVHAVRRFILGNEHLLGIAPINVISSLLEEKSYTKHNVLLENFLGKIAIGEINESMMKD